MPAGYGIPLAAFCARDDVNADTCPQSNERDNSFAALAPDPHLPQMQVPGSAGEHTSRCPALDLHNRPLVGLSQHIDLRASRPGFTVTRLHPNPCADIRLGMQGFRKNLSGLFTRISPPAGTQTTHCIDLPPRLPHPPT